MELLRTLWNILKNKGRNWINTFPENEWQFRTLTRDTQNVINGKA